MTNLTFISGATGGLGKAFAVECASRGWDLFLTDLQEEKLAVLAKALARTYGVSVIPYALDLTDTDARQKMFDLIRLEGWKFRGLINVAGLDHEGLFAERKLEEISAIVRLNVEATLIMTHTLLRFRNKALPFRIINVSSLAAFFSMPVKATYAASKRFLLDFSLALRNELGDHNVTVTVLCPAGMPTTEGSIAAIEAQGLMGQLTTQNVGRVAHETVEAAEHGRVILIPGFLNRALRWLGGFAPAASLTELVGIRWRSARQKMNAQTGAFQLFPFTAGRGNTGNRT
jgi:short-subunit dehydrogenase